MSHVHTQTECHSSKQNERNRGSEEKGGGWVGSRCCDGCHFFFTLVLEEEEELLSPFYQNLERRKDMGKLVI